MHKSFYDIMNVDQKTVATTEHFFIIRDAFPVTEDHMLIISKEIRKDYSELTVREKIDLTNAIDLTMQLVNMRKPEDQKTDHFNVGWNQGSNAGQTVMHFHCHVIPRRAGDMQDPRGGVRHVIPEKGNYLK